MQVMGAGFREGATAGAAGLEIYATKIHVCQFAAHGLNDGDAEIRSGSDEVLEMREFNPCQFAWLESHGGSAVGFAAEGRGKTEDAAGL